MNALLSNNSMTQPYLRDSKHHDLHVGDRIVIHGDWFSQCPDPNKDLRAVVVGIDTEGGIHAALTPMGHVVTLPADAVVQCVTVVEGGA